MTRDGDYWDDDEPALVLCPCQRRDPIPERCGNCGGDGVIEL